MDRKKGSLIKKLSRSVGSDRWKLPSVEQSGKVSWLRETMPKRQVSELFATTFPMFRLGFWPHYALFRYFGVKEGGGFYGTLTYYKGYNAEMDRLLLKRYGLEYSGQ